MHDSLCKKQTSMSAMAIFAVLREDMYIVYFNIFKQASACQPPTREICCIGLWIAEKRNCI